jgi:protein phosphatase PTC7
MSATSSSLSPLLMRRSLTSAALRLARDLPSSSSSSSSHTRFNSTAAVLEPGFFTYRIGAASAPKQTPPRLPKPGRDFWNYTSTHANPNPPYLRSTKPASGEDAFFATTIGGSPHHVAFGLADGVGGWQDQGVDPSVYSQALCGLMAGTANLYEEWDRKPLKPRHLLQQAYDAVTANPRIPAGGCTASLGVADKEGNIETAKCVGPSYSLFDPDTDPCRLVWATPVI